MSSISSNRHFSSHLNTSGTTSYPVPITQPAAATGGTGDVTGDRRLLALYTDAIRRATQTNAGTETIEGIEPDSWFGTWWQQFSNATHSPVFLEWAKSKNIDASEPIKFNAYSDTLTATINGKPTVLAGDQQGPGWREATGVAMAAAKALGHGDIDAPTNPQSAPLTRVARFYGEVLLPDRKEETLERATQLDHNQGFEVLGPNTYVNVEAQSPEALEQQKAELGDSVNKFSLLQALKHRLESAVNYGARSPSNLDILRIPIYPDSTMAQETQQTDATLLQVLSANGLQVPETFRELDNLVRALATPSLTSPHDGNFGGALTWPQPLSVEDQAELFRIIADNQPPLPGLKADTRLGSTDLLGNLMINVPSALLNRGVPLDIMKWVLDSGGAIQLGQALKQRMGKVAEHSTPREILLTALGVTLDLKSLEAPKEHHVAGFNLAAPEYYGQPISVIKQRLIEHLVRTNTTTPQAAPVAAMLLLARVAPELLVKDTPPDMAYGSFSWFTLKTAIGRIEATSPGASALMSFAEIIAFDSVDPVTDKARDIQVRAALPGIIEWGRGQGLLPLQGPYTPEQLSDTQQAFSQRQEEISGAVDAFTADAPTQRAAALAELEAHFGKYIPFEEKSIHKRVYRLDETRKVHENLEGNYSLLDIYLSKKEGSHVWLSSNSAITEEMIDKLKSLPNPIKKHEAAFDKYADNLSAAWGSVTKGLIANLPMEDRKNIEFGKLTVYQRGQLVRSVVNTRNGSHTSERFSSLNDDRSLIIKTERNGLATYYECDPRLNIMRKREEWTALKEGPQGPEVETSRGAAGVSTKYFTAPAIRRLELDDSDVGHEQEGDKNNGVPKSSSSRRSEYLGKLLSENIIGLHRLGDVKDSTLAVTTFDQEDESNAFTRNLILGVIPGASAIYNLANGNYKDAAADIIFDVVMCFTTAGLGKAGGAVKGGRGGSKKFKKVSVASKQLKRVDDLVRQGVVRGQQLTHTQLKQLENLTHSVDDVDLLKATNRSDVAVGTHTPSGSVRPVSVHAKFDEATGEWLPYDVGKNKVYGRPLENFTPETARYFDDALGVEEEFGVVLRRKKPNHLEQSLAKNNAINLGGSTKDFKLIGNGIFTYVDTYKGVDRLNVCAHGMLPDFRELLTDAPISMYYNGATHTPAELLETLKKSSINPQDFNNVRLLMCNSANGSANSFGSQFGKLIQRDVKAFQGPVRVHATPEKAAGIKADINIRYPGLPESDINQKIYEQVKFGLSTSPIKFKVDLLNPPRKNEIPFYYRPVKFKVK
ncbi:hypothetical protein [Pseudomonas poae]|uniref:hypothetical protein n=1 Tax=Pseudomonas poae TaxID=200451 RepID=UPI0030D16498